MPAGEEQGRCKQRWADAGQEALQAGSDDGDRLVYACMGGTRLGSIASRICKPLCDALCQVALQLTISAWSIWRPCTAAAEASRTVKAFIVGDWELRVMGLLKMEDLQVRRQCLAQPLVVR